MEYTIATHDIQEQPIVSMRESRAPDELPRFLGMAFGELLGRLRLLGLAPAGPPLAVYHEFGPSAVDVEVGVPIAQVIEASGRIHARLLPAATVAWTIHAGPYEGLGAAHIAIRDWVRRTDHQAVGPVVERYVSGPGSRVSPADYRTEVEVPIAPVTAPVMA
jgi:effector-binding domain-containing protein